MSMREDGGFFQAKWHWLVLGVGLLTLGGALAYAFGEWGVDPETAAGEAVSGYRGNGGRRETGVADADLAAYQRAAREVRNPTALVSVSPAEGSFLASEKRVHCKFCAGALVPGVKTCPFCAREQPEEEKKPVVAALTAK